MSEEGSVAFIETDIGNELINSPGDFLNIPADKQSRITEWINSNFVAIKNENYRHSSYGLKGLFEKDGGFYVTNGQFKGAMVACGFVAYNKTDINWRFNLLEKSYMMVFRRLYCGGK